MRRNRAYKRYSVVVPVRHPTLNSSSAVDPGSELEKPWILSLQRLIYRPGEKNDSCWQVQCCCQISYCYHGRDQKQIPWTTVTESTGMEAKWWQFLFIEISILITVLATPNPSEPSWGDVLMMKKDEERWRIDGNESTKIYIKSHGSSGVTGEVRPF
jgi:hypothetical protein